MTGNQSLHGGFTAGSGLLEARSVSPSGPANLILGPINMSPINDTKREIGSGDDEEDTFIVQSRFDAKNKDIP